MQLSDLIVSLGWVSREAMGRALAARHHGGAPVAEALMEAGLLTPAQVAELAARVPPVPETVAALGIPAKLVFALLTKYLRFAGTATTARIAEALGLAHRLATAVVAEARAEGIVDARPGIVAGGELRLELTPRGKALAEEALANDTYVGVVPVPLAQYVEWARRQTIRPERVAWEGVESAFADMVLPRRLLERIGAAANSGRAMLLYGAAGNGKTTIAEHLGRLFRTMVMIPHCFEVDGHIVRVFDPALHQRFAAHAPATPGSILADELDPRWVPCRRPFVAAGGELGLHMLDLRFDPVSRFYEAPLHVKAMNGVLLIDDFGRQLAPPAALLNRWVVPMDRGRDYLTLHTGQSFSLPFDVLPIFSTNLSPEDLMDPAFLRRLPYKIHVTPPGEAELAEIFRRESARKGIPIGEALIAEAIRIIGERGSVLAAHQPAAVLDLVSDACAFAGRPAQADAALIGQALESVLLEHGTGHRAAR